MSAPAPDLAQHAHGAVARLSTAIKAGGSSTHLQLICSELFEALKIELDLPTNEVARQEMLSAAIELCKRAGDPKLKAELRLAHLLATVALLQGGLAQQPELGAPRFRVIQGGLA